MEDNEILMGLKVLKWQILHGSLGRYLIFRAFLIASVMGTFPLLFRALNPLVANFDACPLNVSLSPYSIPSGVLKSMPAIVYPLFMPIRALPCGEDGNLTLVVFREMMGKELLDSGASSLCVGEGSGTAVLALRELGFLKALGVDRHPFFSPLRRRFVYEIDYKDNTFDFVFSRALDRVSIPALLVLEIERVLRPGGMGAMLVGARGLYSGGLIRSATPVSAYLKSSDVVHVCGISSFTLVVFKKRFDNVALFEHYRLPDECPSVKSNKPLMKYLEPLVEEDLGKLVTKPSYLPKFMNISSRNRLIYINIGAGEYVNSSITNWLKPFYPMQPQAFNVYVVDHDIFALPSYVKKPGITFVYYPDLAGSKFTASFSSVGELGTPEEGVAFDFVLWFKETVAAGDFIVLAMNAGDVEVKLLFKLFESGAICHVDELFLRCSDSVNCGSAMCGNCMDLLKGLRNSGVFVHQWWGE